MVIGCVPYLNAKPLVEWFYTPQGRESGIELAYDAPSRLAQLVETDKVVCALVSSVELFRHPNWSAVPQIAIASTGKVLSVRLFSKVPLYKVRSVALDTSSLTSSALVQVLFAQRWGTKPEYIPAAPDLEHMLQRADAALLIGDKGMLARSQGLYVADLGEEWYQWTGLPFVWALWLGRSENITPSLVEALLQARQWGQEHIERVIHSAASRLAMKQEVIRHYLCNVMQYEMTTAHEKALERFAQECKRLGLI
ncbi:MAG: menaquinone biosynthesis protein [Armatimonadota bacterium]|nr:menaquinone biosynthesis protein [bacterium]MDW8322198.1 menaquinone biosynthesis protein [Armatimonadota bacterium]